MKLDRTWVCNRRRVSCSVASKERNWPTVSSSPVPAHHARRTPITVWTMSICAVSVPARHVGFGEKPRAWKSRISSLQSKVGCGPSEGTDRQGDQPRCADLADHSPVHVVAALRHSDADHTGGDDVRGADRSAGAAPASITAAEPPWLTSPSNRAIR